MKQNSPTVERPLRIPPVIWFLGIGLATGLVAIFFFNVTVSTVASYGFFAFTMGSHFFMHGGHAGHGSSEEHQHGPVSNALESDESDTNKHSGHTGGCQ